MLNCRIETDIDIPDGIIGAGGIAGYQQQREDYGLLVCAERYRDYDSALEADEEFIDSIYDR